MYHFNTLQIYEKHIRDLHEELVCIKICFSQIYRWRTGLVVRASDSGSGDPGSILGRVGVLFP